MLLVLKLLGIYITTEIKINIDDLIYLYNKTKESSLIFFSGSYPLYREYMSNKYKQTKSSSNKYKTTK